MQEPTIHAIVEVVKSGVQLGQIAVILVDPGSRCACVYQGRGEDKMHAVRLWKTSSATGQGETSPTLLAVGGFW